MNNETFSTKDLHFAAFLKFKGAPLINLERKDINYDYKAPVYFVFGDLELCKTLEHVFWNNIEEDEYSIGNIKDYVDTVRDLRSRTASV
jgi:hypothetical protein